MIVIKEISVLRRYLDRIRQKGSLPGFVPTMGALHEGHIALMNRARNDGHPVICSIFVNPTQFNDAKDFEKYPITIEDDIMKLEMAGVDLLFLPTVKELYPGGTSGLEQYDLGHLETVLEGRFRPGHFQGVCQVMSRLLTAVGACRLYMGQKDYQQCMVVRRLIELKDFPAELIVCPTVREKDGLAMSSRNKRLDAAARKNAVGMYKALSHVIAHLSPGDVMPVREEATRILTDHGFVIDYVELADATTLELIAKWDGKQALVALAAAFQGEVRLIDNLQLSE